MLESDAIAQCPFCNKKQRRNGYFSGKKTSSSLVSNACVIQCEHCKKDFLSEVNHGSINYKIEMEDGSVDTERLERLKNDYGYAQ
jgi:hypothetical protein